MNKRIISGTVLLMIGLVCGFAWDEAQRARSHENAVRHALAQQERAEQIRQANADWNHEMAEKIRHEGNPELADLIEFGPEE